MSKLEPELQQAIAQWSQRIASFCGQSERREELQDHVYCEIERLMQEQQLQPWQAFELATQQLGDEAKLRKELAKNNSLLQHLCAFETRAARIKQQPKLRKWALLHEVFFAVLLLASAWLLRGREDNLAAILFFVLIGLFFATQALVPALRGGVVGLLKRWSK